MMLTGISTTSSGAESGARDAYERGFNVLPAADARPDAHDHAIGCVLPRSGGTGTAGQVVAQLKHTRG